MPDCCWQCACHHCALMSAANSTLLAHAGVLRSLMIARHLRCISPATYDTRSQVPSAISLKPRVCSADLEGGRRQLAAAGQGGAAGAGDHPGGGPHLLHHHQAGLPHASAAEQGPRRPPHLLLPRPGASSQHLRETCVMHARMACLLLHCHCGHLRLRNVCWYKCLIAS